VTVGAMWFNGYNLGWIFRLLEFHFYMNTLLFSYRPHHFCKPQIPLPLLKKKSHVILSTYQAVL
jgi:hypothetical protein